MRVITGTAKGRRLETLSGNDVRPTSDRIKEAVFSIIQFHIEGRRFLDLYAGSGQMGIEALSRGAREAVFVDKNKNALEIIRKNLESTNLKQNARVIATDALSFLRSSAEPFDIAYIDPPYSAGILKKVLPAVCGVMQKSGMILCESPVFDEISLDSCEFVLDREYRYGKIKIAVLRNRELIDAN